MKYKYVLKTIYIANINNDDCIINWLQSKTASCKISGNKAQPIYEVQPGIFTPESHK